VRGTLIQDYDGLLTGARGRLIGGFYRRPDAEVAVISFAGRIELVPTALLQPLVANARTPASPITH
jgi:hypothetical protein